MLLRQVNSIYQNARAFAVAERVLPAHDVIDPLINLPRLWKTLVDDGDEDSKQLFFNVYWLCHDVASCLVPFNSPDLALAARLDAIALEALRYPAMARQLDELQNRIAWLIGHPENPKGQYVIPLLQEKTEAGCAVGLVARMQRVVLYGWHEEFARLLNSVGRQCKLIKTRRDLLDSVFDVIILPGTGRKCPFRSDLYTLCRSQELIVVRYAKERAKPPQLPALPEATVTHQFSDLPSEIGDATDDLGDDLDDWVTNEEWERARLRAQSAGYESGSGSYQFLLRARLVLLETGDAVYLQDDRKVVEVSPLISDESGIQGEAARLPRKLPRQLHSGDLIALRTSGSGDYLDVVADQLLRKAGQRDLRGRSTAWKNDLRLLLEQHGPSYVAEQLAAKGTAVSTPDYIWHWATNDVIRPQKVDAFADLINVINELGGLSDVGNIDTYIDEKWQQMRELIRFQHKAGLQIRRALLSQLLELLQTPTALDDDKVVLSLPDVDAGEITLFRVAAAEPDASEVPYTKINTVF